MLESNAIGRCLGWENTLKMHGTGFVWCLEESESRRSKEIFNSSVAASLLRVKPSEEN